MRKSIQKMSANSFIRLHFAVSKNSIPYFKYSLASYQNLAWYRSGLEVYAHCLDRGSFQYLERHENLTSISSGEGSGSSGHAIAIKSMLDHLGEHVINVITDSDVAIVYRNWDKFLFDFFGQKPIDMLGTQYSSFGTATAGHTHVQQYKNKPTFTWLALGKGVSLNGLDPNPSKNSKITIETPEMAEIYGLPLGFQLLADVGWKLPQYIRKCGLRYELLELVENRDPRCLVLGNLPDYHDEFHLGGLPWLAHQRGSMRHKFRTDPLSKNFYNSVDNFLNFPSWSVHPTKLERVTGWLGRPIRKFRLRFR